MTPRFRRILLGFVALAALTAGVRAAAATPRPAGDFLRYARAGALVWRGEGARIYDRTILSSGHVWGDQQSFPEERFRYSPALAVLMTPFGALDPDLAWVGWSALCAGLIAAAAGLATALAMRLLPEGAPRWLPAAAAVLPLLHLLSENVKLGQMNALAFGLSMGALYAFDRGRDRAAGFLVAGAVVAKHIPILLLFYFAWKGRWKAVLWTLGALALLLYAVPTAVLGPARHHALVGEWANQEDHLVTELGEAPGTVATDGATSAEGQSVKPLLARYLTRTPFRHLVSVQEMKRDPAGHAGVYVNGGREWKGEAVFRIWLAAIAALLVTAVFATRPVEGEDPERARRRFPMEGALVLTTLLLVSPESRNPHFQMLALGHASLAAWFASPARRSGPGRILLGLSVLGALAVLLPTQGLVGRAKANVLLAHGSIGLGALVLFGVLAFILLRERSGAAAAAPAPSPSPSPPASP